MSKREPDHFNPYRHGWAALKMRCPGLRRFDGQEDRVKALCEAYSEAIRFRDRMQLEGDQKRMAEYDEICFGLEQDAHDYLAYYQARRDGAFS
jgi:hypothetical protein